ISALRMAGQSGRGVSKEEDTTDDTIIGESPAIRAVLEQVDVVAASDMPVLILGETGTGKESIARRIHQKSGRAGKCFVAVNCPAVSESLFESEFFGHEKGAYTGAGESRQGKFRQAYGGTMLLDEVGELPISMQPKLLRVLQEQEVQP